MKVQTSHPGDSPPAGVGESLGDAIRDGAALSAMSQPLRARTRAPSRERSHNVGVTSTSPPMSVMTFNSALLSWPPHTFPPPPPATPPHYPPGGSFCATHILLTPAPRPDSWRLVLTWWDERGTTVEVGGAARRMEAGTINHCSLTGEMGERRHRSPAPCHRSSYNERIWADGRWSQPLISRSRQPSGGVTHLQQQSTNSFGQEVPCLALNQIEAVQFSHCLNSNNTINE